MPTEFIGKEEIQLTERNFVGYSAFHIFVNDITGEIVPVECTQAEYDRLGEVGGSQWNPTLAGHTWKHSVGGAIKVDSPTGILGDKEYVVVDDKAYITLKDHICGGLVATPADVIGNKLDTAIISVEKP